MKEISSKMAVLSSKLDSTLFSIAQYRDIQ